MKIRLLEFVAGDSLFRKKHSTIFESTDGKSSMSLSEAEYQFQHNENYIPTLIAIGEREIRLNNYAEKILAKELREKKFSQCTNPIGVFGTPFCMRFKSKCQCKIK